MLPLYSKDVFKFIEGSTRKAHPGRIVKQPYNLSRLGLNSAMKLIKKKGNRDVVAAKVLLQVKKIIKTVNDDTCDDQML